MDLQFKIWLFYVGLGWVMLEHVDWTLGHQERVVAFFGGTLAIRLFGIISIFFDSIRFSTLFLRALRGFNWSTGDDICQPVSKTSRRRVNRTVWTIDLLRLVY